MPDDFQPARVSGNPGFLPTDSESLFMIRCCSVVVFIFLSLNCTRLNADDSPFVVAGYLPDYRVESWSREIGPVTDLILFGMSAPKDGTFDSNAINHQHIGIVQDVKRKTQCRLLFTVGGWNKSEGFSVLATDQTLRRTFIQDALRFCRRHGFDGIDYDWEHPAGDEQINAFADLLAETHAEFSQQNLLVTVAQAGWQDLGRRAYQSVDRIHLMAYDHDFPQATFEKAQADVERLQSFGCPARRITVGLPFYGRNKNGEARTYAELSTVPAFQADASVIDGFACNGTALIERKTRFARECGLAGVMIWEIGQDTTGPHSLLQTLSRALEQNRSK